MARPENNEENNTPYLIHLHQIALKLSTKYFSYRNTSIVIPPGTYCAYTIAAMQFKKGNTQIL